MKEKVMKCIRYCVNAVLNSVPARIVWIFCGAIRTATRFSWYHTKKKLGFNGAPEGIQIGMDVVSGSIALRVSYEDGSIAKLVFPADAVINLANEITKAANIVKFKGEQ